jgi:hypothetical protein
MRSCIGESSMVAISGTEIGVAAEIVAQATKTNPPAEGETIGCDLATSDGVRTPANNKTLVTITTPIVDSATAVAQTSKKSNIHAPIQK